MKYLSLILIFLSLQVSAQMTIDQEVRMWHTEGRFFGSWGRPDQTFYFDDGEKLHEWYFVNEKGVDRKVRVGKWCWVQVWFDPVGDKITWRWEGYCR